MEVVSGWITVHEAKRYINVTCICASVARITFSFLFLHAFFFLFFYFFFFPLSSFFLPCCNFSFCIIFSALHGPCVVVPRLRNSDFGQNSECLNTSLTAAFAEPYWKAYGESIAHGTLTLFKHFEKFIESNNTEGHAIRQNVPPRKEQRLACSALDRQKPFLDAQEFAKCVPKPISPSIVHTPERQDGEIKRDWGSSGSASCRIIASRVRTASRLRIAHGRRFEIAKLWWCVQNGKVYLHTRQARKMSGIDWWYKHAR